MALSLAAITFSTAAGFASAANIASAESIVNGVENAEASMFSKVRSFWNNRTNHRYLNYIFSGEYAPHKIVILSYYRDVSLIAKNTADYILKPIWEKHNSIILDG